LTILLLLVVDLVDRMLVVVAALADLEQELD
jgi:hypothetical protein